MWFWREVRALASGLPEPDPSSGTNPEPTPAGTVTGVAGGEAGGTLPTTAVTPLMAVWRSETHESRAVPVGGVIEVVNHDED